MVRIHFQEDIFSMVLESVKGRQASSQTAKGSHIILNFGLSRLEHFREFQPSFSKRGSLLGEIMYFGVGQKQIMRIY